MTAFGCCSGRANFTAAGSGGGAPGAKVSVDTNDLTSDFLALKLVAGSGIALTVLNPGASESLRVDASGVAATPTTSNKAMAASVTTQDGDLACATAVATAPATSSAAGGAFQVLVNGVSVVLGNAVKAGKACYFSGDGGVTPRNQRAIIVGDRLYWNPSVAGFQLAASDLIDFIYWVTT